MCTEQGEDAMLGAVGGGADTERVPHLIQQLLEDEGTLNHALEECRYDYSHHKKYTKLRYRSEVWLGGAVMEQKKGEACTLESCLDVVRAQLENTWVTAIATGDRQIKSMLEHNLPPSSVQVAALVDECANR